LSVDFTCLTFKFETSSLSDLIELQNAVTMKFILTMVGSWIDFS